MRADRTEYHRQKNPNMRSIDNMTDKEREVLALKGMTASGTVKQGRRPMYKSFVTQRDEYKAHADKLAEALRGLLQKFVTVESYPHLGPPISNKFVDMATAETKARQALAAYEQSL